MIAPVVSHTFQDMTGAAIKNPAQFREKTEFLSKPNALMDIPSRLIAQFMGLSQM